MQLTLVIYAHVQWHYIIEDHDFVVVESAKPMVLVGSDIGGKVKFIEDQGN